MGDDKFVSKMQYMHGIINQRRSKYPIEKYAQRNSDMSRHYGPLMAFSTEEWVRIVNGEQTCERGKCRLAVEEVDSYDTVSAFDSFSRLAAIREVVPSFVIPMLLFHVDAETLRKKGIYSDVVRPPDYIQHYANETVSIMVTEDPSPGTTLRDLLLNKGAIPTPMRRNAVPILYSAVAQVLLALRVAFDRYGYVDNGLETQRVVACAVDKSYVDFPIDGVAHRVPTYGFVWMIEPHGDTHMKAWRNPSGASRGPSSFVKHVYAAARNRDSPLATKDPLMKLLRGKSVDSVAFVSDMLKISGKKLDIPPKLRIRIPNSKRCPRGTGFVQKIKRYRDCCPSYAKNRIVSGAGGKKACVANTRKSDDQDEYYQGR